MRYVCSDFLADAGSESSVGNEQDRIHMATGTTPVRGNRAWAAIQGQSKGSESTKAVDSSHA